MPYPQTATSKTTDHLPGDRKVLPPLPAERGERGLKVLARDGSLLNEGAEFRKDRDALVGGRIHFEAGSVHLSGTGKDGSYIEADGYIKDGKRTGSARSVPQVYFESKEELISVLELTIKDPEKGIFTRPGFTGSYRIQREMDGSCSVFYTGGIHRNGSTIKKLPPQTFVHGLWNVDRTSPRNVMSSQKETLRNVHRGELEKVASEVLSRTDREGINHSLAGKDSNGGTGFYSINGSIIRHASSSSEESVQHRTEVAFPDLDVRLPTGSSLEEITARRDLAPAIRVERSIDGTTLAGFAFLRKEGVRQGVFFVSENDTTLPSEVLLAYKNASQNDGSLRLHIWQNTDQEGISRTMVRSDGSVLIDRNSGTGRFELLAPDLRNTSEKSFVWKSLEMVRGNEMLGEPDFVESKQSKSQRREQESGGVDTLAQDQETIRMLAEQAATKHARPGLHIIPGLALPEDTNRRNKVVTPFQVTASDGSPLFVFPRRFNDRSTGEMVSGLLMISQKQVQGIEAYDPGALKAAHTAYASRTIETWHTIEGEKSQVNLRSDGSFVFRESPDSDQGILYRPLLKNTGDISWDSIPVVKGSDGRYQPGGMRTPQGFSTTDFSQGSFNSRQPKMPEEPGWIVRSKDKVVSWGEGSLNWGRRQLEKAWNWIP